MTEAGSGVGWRRRDRTSDVGAAALITLGGLVAKCAGVVPAGRVLGWLFVAAGAALALLYRDRWLERTDGEVWLGTAWWWLRPWGARRVRLRPARVVVEPEGTGWWARRRTVLSIANDVDASTPAGGGSRAVEVLERWTEPSCQEYAQSVAASLARWLGVSTGGVLAPFEPLSAELARAHLRASLAALNPTGRSTPSRARSQVAGRTHLIEVGRRWFEVSWWAWVVVLGATLATLWRLGGSDRLSALAFLAALPMGAVLLLEGLRGVLPGRVVTHVGPDALSVERVGPSQELRLQVLFSDLVGVTLQWDHGWWQSSSRFRRVLTLVLRDQIVVVQAAELGLRPSDLPWFVGVCRGAMEAWLDRFPEAAAGQAASPTPTAPDKAPSPITTHRPDRYRPSSILAVLGSMFPRLASVAGALLLLGLHPLRIAVERDILAVPSHVQVGAFTTLGSDVDMVARFAALIAGGLAAATLTLAGFKLMWSAPRFPGLVVLAALSTLTPMVQVVGLAWAAPDGIRVVDICEGGVSPPRFPIEVSGDGKEIRYGAITARRPRPSKGVGWGPHWFDRVADHADSLLEVQGLFGGQHLVVAEDYARICGGWKKRLAEAGR